MPPFQNKINPQIEEHNQRVKLNREIMVRLINITKYLVKTESAFRGHNEKKNSENRGCFKELLRFQDIAVLIKVHQV